MKTLKNPVCVECGRHVSKKDAQDYFLCDFCGGRTYAVAKKTLEKYNKRHNVI